MFTRRRMMLSTAAVLGAGAIGTTLSAKADTAPVPLALSLVEAAPRVWNGRDCLAVELTNAFQAKLLAEPLGPNANGASYVTVRPSFANGVIEVDVAGELTGRGAADSRAFVGVAFHIDHDRTFDAVYLRMTNGSLNDPAPPAPRIDRAVQYVAHPDFHFDESRKVAPGRYERGAKVALGRWHAFRLEITGGTCRALVDGEEVLAIDDLRFGGKDGPVALWIGNGTRGYFSNLRVSRGSA